MKKCIPVMIAAAILLALILRALAGAGEKPYEVYEENDQWYIKADVGIPWEVTGVQYGQEIAYVEFYSYDGVIERAAFPSVAKLRSEVLDHSLSVRQLQWLQHFAGGRSTPIPICDLDDLYDPVVPESVAVSEITFCGDSYTCDFSGDDYSGEFQVFYDENDYLDCLSNTFGFLYAKFPEICSNEVGADKTIWDVRKESDAVFNQFSPSVPSTERYILNTGTDNWYVKQPYVGEDTDEAKTIHMFCQRENVAFWIQINLNSKNPPIQFLADFGVKPVE